MAAGFGGGSFDGNVLLRLWGMRDGLYIIDEDLYHDFIVSTNIPFVF